MPTTPDAATALRRTTRWFEENSGWAPPDPDTLADWVAEGLARCPDDCVAAHDGWCEHGLASWWLVLRDLGDPVPPPPDPVPPRPAPAPDPDPGA